MGLGVTRASTQDGTGGTQVATTTNEDGSAGAIGLTAMVGNKTIYPEVSRTGITAADAPTGGDLTTTGFAGAAGANLQEIGNFIQGAIRATCGTASATLKGRLVAYDGSNNAIWISAQQTFISDPTLRLGNASGDFLCSPVGIELWRARKVRFFVDSVSAGTWAVYVGPV